MNEHNEQTDEQGLSAELICNWSALAVLEGEWNHLLQHSRADNVFLTWEWLWSWAQATRQACKPFVVLVRDRLGTLLGIAPLYVAPYRLMRLFPYRVLRVLADYPTGAEYPEWIAHRDHEQNVLRTIAGCLHAQRQSWDAIWMPNMASWTDAVVRHEAACRASGLGFTRRATSFSAFRLPPSVEAYLESLSANMRSTLRRQEKNITAQPGVEVSVCRNLEELPEYLNALFDLHARRWSRKGQEGVFRRKPAERAFYEHFAVAAFQAGWLRLHGLRDQGAFKAVQIGYVYKNNYHLLQEGFDPDYQDGAGNVLRLAVIKSCIEAGLSHYDFLGGVSEHKRRWRAVERMGDDALIFSSRPKSRLLWHCRIWPTGRFLRAAC